MSLSDLASLGSLLSGVGVLVSLIYLSLQIRQNTRAVRSQIHQHITDGWFSMGSIVTANARVFTAGISSNADSFAAMPDADKYAFMSSIFVFFKHFENMYLRVQGGSHCARELECMDADDVHVLAHAGRSAVVEKPA